MYRVNDKMKMTMIMTMMIMMVRTMMMIMMVMMKVSSARQIQDLLHQWMNSVELNSKQDL